MNYYRKDFFECYGENRPEKKVFNDAFLDDAFDGWRKNGLDESAFKKIDVHFVPRFSFIYPISILIFLGITLFTLEERPKKTNIDKKVISQVNSPLLKNRTENPVIATKKTTNQNKKNAETKIKNTVKQSFEEKISEKVIFNYESLPLLPFGKIETKMEARINIAKETYLDEYKVVDYRFYRKKPLDKSNEDLLTGVPASFESNVESNTDKKLEIEKSYFDYLEKTLKLLKSGQYSLAIIRFQEILKTYELDINGLFYLALSQFETNKYQDCIETLEKLKLARFTNFDDDANWYRLNCYLKLNKKSQFEELKKKMIETESNYSQLVKNINF